jgi:hypothetical protein
MSQYNLKQGIKKFGDPGKAAVLTELRQLYDRHVISPVNKYNLTGEEQKRALRYLMFLKEKRCGTIKGRGCADGGPQRDYMSKEETSSPTVATEALILSCIVDAAEGRDVATCDIPGAFMQSDMKGKVVMKLEGVMAEVIVKIDPNNTRNMSQNKIARISYTSSWQKPSTALSRPPYYFGKTFRRSSRSGDLKLIHTTSV